MILAAHQPQYFPYPGYLDKIARADLFVVLDRVQYKKREWQNRNRILGPRGPQWITVPVATKGLYDQCIADVAIDNDRSWRADHLASLRLNYARAPHWPAWRDWLADLFARPWPTLSGLNQAVTREFCARLGIITPWALESEVGTTAVSTRRLVELCQKLGADAYLSGAGGRDYLEADLFARAGIRLLWQDYHPVPYPQQFVQPGGFVPYLSVFDLLANAGPLSRPILDQGGTLSA